MNKPSPQEQRAMRARYSVTKTPVYQVMSCGVVVFENSSYALCNWFCNQHGIKSKPKTKK